MKTEPERGIRKFVKDAGHAATPGLAVPATADMLGHLG